MTGRTAFRVGQAIGWVVAVAIVIGYAMLGDALRLTADDADGDVLIWFYDGDAAPGQHMQGRAWVDGDENWVVGVDVMFYGAKIGVDDCPADCQASSADFDFTIPATAKTGDELDIDVETKPGYRHTRFKRALAVTSPRMSALRRAGKAGLALAALAAQAGLLFLLARRALRRQRSPSPFWLLPVVAAGYLAFVPLAIDVTRLHGVWFDGVGLAAWAAAAYAVADRLNRRIGLARFEVVQLLHDMAGADAYREANVSVPIRPVDDLANAWAALGLNVERAGRDLIVTGPGKRIAIVHVPRSESVGGEPLVFRASDAEYADLLVAAASDVLGELRFA